MAKKLNDHLKRAIAKGKTIGVRYGKTSMKFSQDNFFKIIDGKNHELALASLRNKNVTRIGDYHKQSCGLLNR